jgi:hypothetical protein
MTALGPRSGRRQAGGRACPQPAAHRPRRPLPPARRLAPLLKP